MLKIEHVNFLIELCNVPGVNVPIKSARLAADTLEALQALKISLEAVPPLDTPASP